MEYIPLAIVFSLKILFALLIIFSNLDNIFFLIAKKSAIMTVILHYLIMFTLCLNFSNKRFYHKTFGYLFIFYSLLHSIMHAILIYEKNIVFKGLIYITGLCLILYFILMSLASNKNLINKNFNIFYYIHIFSLLMNLILILHSKYFIIPTTIVFINYIYNFLKISVITPYMDEKIYNLNNNKVYARHIECVVDINKNIVPSDECHLISSKINALEKHPFTIINTEIKKNQKYITICMASRGNWTKKIMELLENCKLGNLFIYNVHASIIRRLINHNNNIIIVENIGITTYLGYVNYIMYEKVNNRLTKIPKITLIFRITNNLNLIHYLESQIAEICKNYKNDPKNSICSYLKIYIIITENYNINETRQIKDINVNYNLCSIRFDYNNVNKLLCEKINNVNKYDDNNFDDNSIYDNITSETQKEYIICKNIAKDTGLYYIKSPSTIPIIKRYVKNPDIIIYN